MAPGTERAGQWKVVFSTPSKIWSAGLSAGLSRDGLRLSVAWTAHPGDSRPRPADRAREN